VVELSVLFQFIAVFLLPMIPAALLFWRIPPKRIDTSVEGAIFGFSIKAGGAAALYCVLTLLSAYIYNSIVDHGKQIVEGAVTITVLGDSDDIQKYFNTIGSRIALQFQDNDQVIASARGFIPDPEKNIIYSDNFTFEERLEGHKVDVMFTPQRKNLKLTKVPDKIGRSMAMTLTVSPISGGDFVSSVDLESINYTKQGRALTFKHAIILDNLTPGVLSWFLAVRSG
jgi:hypothetical protein